VSHHKPKGHKRPKSWHRGQVESHRWQAVDLPEVDSGANPTTGKPAPWRRGRPHRGEAL
jgi:hypothetical protein